jgi:hypothetical protein
VVIGSQTVLLVHQPGAQKVAETPLAAFGLLVPCPVPVIESSTGTPSSKYAHPSLGRLARESGQGIGPACFLLLEQAKRLALCGRSWPCVQPLVLTQRSFPAAKLAAVASLDPLTGLTRAALGA